MPAQAITSEMHSYAKDLLYTFLSELANKASPPSWCVEKVLLPMYEGQAVVDLPVGTVNILNCNYRSLEEVEDDEPPAATTISYTAAAVTTVGLKWSGTPVDVTIQASEDNLSWITVGTIEADNYSSGEWAWVDVNTKAAYAYLRLTASSNINVSRVYLGKQPREIPLGLLNRDMYADQSDKTFASRPTDYWPQKNLPLAQVNLWPTPRADDEVAQLVVWRHRHIMDVGTLRQDLEIPQQWLEAIIACLAERVAMETPEVDLTLQQTLEMRASKALAEAWAGDGDGTPTRFQINIRGYTA